MCTSIMSNVKLVNSVGTVRCIPWARVGDVESYLKLPCKDKQIWKDYNPHKCNDTQ